MARLFRARLRAGADPGVVHQRTGVLLWAGEWKALSEFNIGTARTDLLYADPDVEIETDSAESETSNEKGGMPLGGRQKRGKPEAADAKEAGHNAG
jgi:hypothetical protein